MNLKKPILIIASIIILFVIAAGVYLYLSGRLFGKHRQVIIITLDTTRVDHFGCYGNSEVLTPNIDAFAKDSVVFTNCFSTTHTTNPSHTSIFTSLYLKDHMVTDNKTRFIQYPEIMSKMFKGAGFKTAAFTSVNHLQEVAGLDQGFDYFSGTDTSRTAEATNKNVIDWLSNNLNSDFFIWVHYYDPHMPYSPPPPYDKMYNNKSSGDIDDIYIDERYAYGDYFKRSKDPEYYRNQYKGEISYLDFQIGRILQYLKDKGIYDNCTIVMVADHGESLGNHNQYFIHRNILYDDTIRVPLIFKMKGQASSGERRQMASSLDIYPTLLELSGIKHNLPIRGISLLNVLKDPDAKEVRDTAYSEAAHLALMSVRTARYTYIYNMLDITTGLKRDPDKAGAQELYDNLNDKGQHVNLFSSHPEIGKSFFKKAEVYRKDRLPVGNNNKEVTDEKTLQKLRSLGYVR